MNSLYKVDLSFGRQFSQLLELQMFMDKWLYHSAIACIRENFDAPKLGLVKIWLTFRYIPNTENRDRSSTSLANEILYTYIGQGTELHGEYLNLGLHKFMTFRC